MSNSRHFNAISNRLSLRAPQRESLDILSRIAEIIPLQKDQDVAHALQVIKSEYPTVQDFERDFPSLCFALATGVGKTRLMGAFISYLYLEKGIRHFFVLAPNLTIYNKLIADFTAGSPKYVFQGIAEFVTYSPEVITGDNYESGRGIRRQNLFGEEGPHINIFNISKINAEVRGGAAPRIKRLSEYIGQSYFDYLAELDDLVLLMDESHRYRAGAGVRAINELKPILGLELTATPQIETGGGAVQKFKNVIYSYPLANAMKDGFVKEPAVATRENFNRADYSDAQLERLKLDDGVRVHESAKLDLELYASQNDRPRVKPFMMVVAQDTDHANAIVATIKQDDFFGGYYANRVITVHSNQRGEEKDEVVERLVAVESPDEPTEIVVHVNMLKEGWDVTNLYTIVPLRAANSRTLVEQSIGRGLRLPYGKRTGNLAVDRLTIVAHDKFQEIIDDANNPNSLIRTGVVIGRDIPTERQTLIVVPSNLETRLFSGVGALLAAPNPNAPAPAALPLASETQSAYSASSTPAQPPLFTTTAEQTVARAALAAVRQFESLPRSADLRAPEIQAQIVARIEANQTPAQGTLTETIEAAPNIAEVVAATIDQFIAATIDIPRISVVPKGELRTGFHSFTLDLSSVHVQPVAQDILIHHLRTNDRERLGGDNAIAAESNPANYLVRALMNYNDICYDDHADQLYDLSGQVLAHLRAYLPDQDALHNVLQFHQRHIAELVHSQMQAHRWEHATDYETHVNRGFASLRPNNFTASATEPIRDVRAPVAERQDIRRMLFGGFRRCLYPVQKFQSDPERRFAILLEDEPNDLKWFKPAPNQFQIYYNNDRAYEPDFVVETATHKLLCEPKCTDEITDEEVQAKARAAAVWCRQATDHEIAHDGQPWAYLLIPHTAITAMATLSGLLASYRFAQSE